MPTLPPVIKLTQNMIRLETHSSVALRGSEEKEQVELRLMNLIIFWQ